MTFMLIKMKNMPSILDESECAIRFRNFLKSSVTKYKVSEAYVSRSDGAIMFDTSSGRAEEAASSIRRGAETYEQDIVDIQFGGSFQVGYSSEKARVADEIVREYAEYLQDVKNAGPNEEFIAPGSRDKVIVIA